MLVIVLPSGIMNVSMEPTVIDSALSGAAKRVKAKRAKAAFIGTAFGAIRYDKVPD